MSPVLRALLVAAALAGLSGCASDRPASAPADTAKPGTAAAPAAAAEASRVVDEVKIGDAASEKAHDLQGKETEDGEHEGRNWRHATDGGWFSFRMKVLPDRPVRLVCTYWGSDEGDRVFDVMVDGQKVATQALENNKPDAFFDVTYRVPETLTQGKSGVTVKFQAHPDNYAGGVFGLKVVQ